MDRREALKKLAVGGVTAAGVTAVMTSTAFGDGGTANCRPTNVSTANPALTTNVTGLAKSAVRVISNLASLALATCDVCHGDATPASSVQYRWTVDAAPGGTTVGMYDAGSLGNRIDTAFQATLFTNAYLRNVAGGDLTAGTYSIRLTARWICTNCGISWRWRGSALLRARRAIFMFRRRRSARAWRCSSARSSAGF